MVVKSSVLALEYILQGKRIINKTNTAKKRNWYQRRSVAVRSTLTIKTTFFFDV